MSETRMTLSLDPKTGDLVASTDADSGQPQVSWRMPQAHLLFYAEQSKKLTDK